MTRFEVGMVDASGRLPIAVLVPLAAGVLNGLINAGFSFLCGGDPIAAFGSGFLSGAVTSAVALALGHYSGLLPVVSGAIGSLVGAIAAEVFGDGLQASDIQSIGISTALGGIGGKVASTGRNLIPSFSYGGDLLKWRTLLQWTKNPIRILKQDLEATFIGALGAAVPDCPCN